MKELKSKQTQPTYPSGCPTLYVYQVQQQNYPKTIFEYVPFPQDLAYTYKINPADFAEPWNATHYGVGLVPSDPACGCGSFSNDDDVEGNIALIGTTDGVSCYF